VPILKIDAKGKPSSTNIGPESPSRITEQDEDVNDDEANEQRQHLITVN
jgi:hypothetical protein